MNNRRKHTLIGIGIVLLLAFSLREYLGILLLLLGALIWYILPTALSIGALIVVGYLGYSYFFKSGPPAALPTIHPLPGAAQLATQELSERLRIAFVRNNTRQMHNILLRLPNWPISQQIQQTATGLVELKRSIARAQAEGVPVAMIERYMNNLNQAAESVWQLASKVDAVGLQQISYDIVAARLHQEDRKLDQLQQALTAAHEGIALLILSGTKSDVLADIEDDLHALTQAIKNLEVLQTQPQIPDAAQV